MNTIVVGYNQSEASERALDRAAELARLFGAKLLVTSVVPVLIGGDSEDGRVPEEVRERVAKLGVEAELVDAVGDPAEAIVEVADRNGADMIVVGTREPSLIERQLGHSVSEAVQRRARCDVLIVH